MDLSGVDSTLVDAFEDALKVLSIDYREAVAETLCLTVGKDEFRKPMAFLAAMINFIIAPKLLAIEKGMYNESKRWPIPALGVIWGDKTLMACIGIYNEYLIHKHFIGISSTYIYVEKTVRERMGLEKGAA